MLPLPCPSRFPVSPSSERLLAGQFDPRDVAGEPRRADGDHASTGLLHTGVCSVHGEDSFEVSLVPLLSVRGDERTLVAQHAGQSGL